MINQRSQDEKVLVDVRKTLFASSGLANRGQVMFLADATRWPVREWVIAKTNDEPEYQVIWLQPDTIGSATLSTATPSVLAARVHPLRAIQRIELTGEVVPDFPTDSVRRTITVHFTDGDAIVVGPATEKEKAESFIEALLESVHLEET